MESNFGSYQELFGQVDKIGSGVMDQFKVLYLLMKDSEVPAPAKVVPALGVGAAVWLIKHEGIIPDKVPFFGKLDNYTLAGLAIYAGMKALEWLAPQQSVAKAWNEVIRQKAERENVVEEVKAGNGAKETNKSDAGAPGWPAKD